MAKRTDAEKQKAFQLVDAGKTQQEAADQLGIPRGTVSSWVRQRDKDPQHEGRRTAQRVQPPDGDQPPDAADPVPGRADEEPPRRPPEGRVEVPQKLNYATISGHIEGIYKFGAHAIAVSEPALAQAVDSHAAAAGHAWASWIQSEPKVAALLERLMVGTPLGEVIGVHVSIAFAYFLSRDAYRQAVRDAEAAENGASDRAPEGDVVYGPEQAPA